MIIRSNILTREDLVRELANVDHVDFAEPIQTFKPRKFAHGFRVYLEGYGTRHRRARNGGTYGAGGSGKAATWDDWGVWIDRLYAIDPNAEIAYYKSRSHFRIMTRQYKPRDMSAPWLAK